MSKTTAQTELTTLLEDVLIGTETHQNAPAVTIGPRSVQETLTRLRERAGYDHLSCVTAQEYPDRFESIYHLKRIADPTDEVSVVVPVPKDTPVSETATPVFQTAAWHEREAYDLMGIKYDGHPNLERILLPETWQGHPLRNEYNQDKPQVATLEEHDNPLAADHRDGETMFLNVGPHHPATHGVLHLKTVLDGEQVIDVEPDIGYLHRCEEQLCQSATYKHQIMPYPDRWDYVSSGLLNEWAYARVAEDLAEIEVPEYAQVIRTMGAELSRIAAHMLAIGTFALDINGDFTATFMYAMREREKTQQLLEELTGQRMMFNYFRLGGVAWDLPDPREEFIDQVRAFLNDLPEAIEEFHDLMTNNEIFQLRTVDTGVLEPSVAKDYGVTGPVLRGSGVDYDLRRDDPYGYYEQLDWDVVTESGQDNFSRVLVRLREIEQSARIIDQTIDMLEDWPEDERTVQARVPRKVTPEAGQEIYRAVEGAKGELGIYIRTDGSDTPARFKIRGPSFSNLQVLPELAEGEYLPDLIAALGSLDLVLGEVDR